MYVGVCVCVGGGGVGGMCVGVCACRCVFYLMKRNLVPTNVRVQAGVTLHQGQHSALMLVGWTCICGPAPVEAQDAQARAETAERFKMETLPRPETMRQDVVSPSIVIQALDKGGAIATGMS